MVNVKGDEEVRLKEKDSSYHITANGIQLLCINVPVYYRKYAAAKAASPFNNGPVLEGSRQILSPDFPHRNEGKTS